jgi:hypothetical protein
MEMKKILTAVTLVVLLGACGNKNQNGYGTNNGMLTDSINASDHMGVQDKTETTDEFGNPIGNDAASDSANRMTSPHQQPNTRQDVGTDNYNINDSVR